MTDNTIPKVEDLKVGNWIFYQRRTIERVQVIAIRDGVPYALGGWFGRFPIRQENIRADWGF